MEKEKRRRTNPEDLDLALDLGHAHDGVDIVPFDEFHGDLLSPVCVQPEFDLAELALSEGLEEEIRAELWNGPPGMVCSIGECCGV